MQMNTSLDSTKLNHTDLLRLKQAAAHLNISLQTLWRLGEQEPTFPKKIKLSTRVCFYRRSDLDEWIKSREV
jgi:prophage regulatory protein